MSVQPFPPKTLSLFWHGEHKHTPIGMFHSREPNIEFYDPLDMDGFFGAIFHPVSERALQKVTLHQTHRISSNV